MPVLSPLSFSRYFINVTCEQVVIKNTVFKIWLPFPFYNVILCDYKTVTTVKIRFYSSIHKSESIFYHVSWKYIPLPACCSIIDKYRFRQRGKRERQQTSMLLLWWTASTVRFSMSMCSACDVATSPAVGVCWKKKWTSKKEIVAERTREWEMSSGGSDICIHFLSFSEGRERRKGGVVAV